VGGYSFLHVRRPCVPEDLSSASRKHLAPVEIRGQDAVQISGPGRYGEEVESLFACQERVEVYGGIVRCWGAQHVTELWIALQSYGLLVSQGAGTAAGA
jgi:hypothetical protein